LDDYYKYYKSLSSNPVSKEVFKDIVLNFNEEVIHKCIYNAFEFHIPRIGDVRVKKRKAKAFINPDGSLNTRYLSVDWKATNDLRARDPIAKEKRQKVFHLNRHTQGYIYRWFWSKDTVALPNKSIYSLDVMRKYDRELKDALNNSDLNIDFYE